MKLLLYDVDFNSEIEWNDGDVLAIECDSPGYFAQLVAQCKGYDEGHIALLCQEQVLPWDKNAVVIVDYYALDTWQKTAFAKFCKQLDARCRGEDWAPLIDKLEEDVRTLLQQLDEDDMQWQYEVPRTVSAYLKLANAHVANLSGTIDEELRNLCSLMALTNSFAVCVLVNAKSFFTHSQLDEILKVCVYNGQKVLLLDNIRTQQLHFNEKKVVIEEDFYDIMLSV